jgi:hypothetical protein
LARNSFYVPHFFAFAHDEEEEMLFMRLDKVFKLVYINSSKPLAPNVETKNPGTDAAIVNYYFTQGIF